jgi:membrane-associated protease RseP (regulator of RpoE activity)
VGVTPLTKQLSDHFGVTSGALINNVREDSPAARAGLKAGDVIVEVDGKAVKGEWDLIRAIGEKKDGDVSLTIVRAGERQTIRVAPEEGKDRFDSFFEYRSMPSPPDSPTVPEVFRFERSLPIAPVPLNHMFFPGRVV